MLRTGVAFADCMQVDRGTPARVVSRGIVGQKINKFRAMQTIAKLVLPETIYIVPHLRVCLFTPTSIGIDIMEMMTMTSARRLLVALPLMMLAAPYAIQGSAAAGSAYYQSQKNEANARYKALHQDDYRVMPPTFFKQRKAEEPMYATPRGGREY